MKRKPGKKLTVGRSNWIRFIFSRSTYIPWSIMFKSEERQIVERIKDYIKKEEYIGNEYRIMLRNGRILYMKDYFKMVRRGKINPQDAYVYIWSRTTAYKYIFYYLFLIEYSILLFAYLSKLGFYYEDCVVPGKCVAPATGLKYIAEPVNYDKYLSIEVINLDTVVGNLNLPKIVVEVLDGKLISGKKELTKEEYRKINNMFSSQRLFAGHNFEEARDIIESYYEGYTKPPEKEVARIAADYYRIFQPYRACYDMDNWKEIDCWSIKLG